jgi:undecaprenyl diphosphate synthase
MKTLATENQIIDIVKSTNLQHIAIIMDGNRRWAKSKFLPSAAGHQKGVEALRKTIKACLKFGIKYLTVYAFSTENWNRQKEEVDFLMTLLAKTITAEIPEFLEKDVKVTFIGDRKSLQQNLITILENCEKETLNCKTLNLQIAFNYGSKMEITNAVKEIAQKVQNKEIEINDITENTITEHLYTSKIPNPDLLIRTGGEKRISNYLLWQCAYSEIYVTNTFWPDFNEKALSTALTEFNLRQRRFGK